MGRVRTCRDAQSHDGRLVGGFNDVGMEIDKRWIEVAPDDGFQTQNGFVEVPRGDAGASHRFAFYLRYAIQNDPARSVGECRNVGEKLDIVILRGRQGLLVIKKFTFSCPRLEDVIDVLFGPFNGWRKVHGVVESAAVLKLQRPRPLRPLRCRFLRERIETPHGMAKQLLGGLALAPAGLEAILLEVGVHHLEVEHHPRREVLQALLLPGLEVITGVGDRLPEVL